MPQLTEVEKQALLDLARQALNEAVRSRRLSPIPARGGALDELSGAFVTLRCGNRLRGCIGYIIGLKPLYQTVRECAMAAALRDPRFQPVTPEELPYIHLEISVLSPLVRVSPEQVEIGKHGLLISDGFQHGLLLPQVAVEQNWDREAFLNETCQKAGLDYGAWRQGAEVYAFTAEVFGEPETVALPPEQAA